MSTVKSKLRKEDTIIQKSRHRILSVGSFANESRNGTSRWLSQSCFENRWQANSSINISMTASTTRTQHVVFAKDDMQAGMGLLQSRIHAPMLR